MTRLRFDENLSASLIPRLRDVYPAALHVRELGYGGAFDAQVWALAKEHDAVLVSRDEDCPHGTPDPHQPQHLLDSCVGRSGLVGQGRSADGDFEIRVYRVGYLMSGGAAGELPAMAQPH